MTDRPVDNPIGGRAIVCVGFNDWQNEVWTNQHHLMYRLAATGSPVLFIESLGLRRPSLASGRDLTRIARRLRTGLAPARRLDGVTVLSPLVLPLHGNRVVRACNARILRGRVSAQVRRLGLEHPVLWAYVPQAEALIDVLDPELIVYHCVDDIAAQTGVDAGSFEAAEARFAARADLVIASSGPLAERMRRFSDRVLLAPNVADTELFAAALEPGPVDDALARLPEPRLVFIGAVAAKKLDFELLAGIARTRRDWSLALVGPVGLGDPTTDVTQLASEPNVHLLGARAHADLPTVLRGASVGLIPYRSSRLTASIFPMKVYEYLAAGVAIVAAGLPSLGGVDDVWQVTDVASAVAAIERVLADDSVAARQARSAAARRHSWESRLAEIGAALRT